MNGNKHKRREEQEKDRTQNHLRCQVCGRIVKPAACSWEEDEGGAIYCEDCRAEKESCGCSD